MSRITNFPGGYSPVFSFGPDKFSGPTEYQVVALHNNVTAIERLQHSDGTTSAPGAMLGHGADGGAAAHRPN